MTDPGFHTPQHDLPHQSRVVEARLAVGQHGDGGDAGRPKREGGTGDGFAIFKPGLAERGAQIDQTRAQHRALGLDDRSTVRRAERGTEIGDAAVPYQQFAFAQRLSRFVQEPDFTEKDLL